VSNSSLQLEKSVIRRQELSLRTFCLFIDAEQLIDKDLSLVIRLRTLP